MSYSPPTIGAAGLTIPTYNDILQELIGQYQGIFGAAVYLGVDSPDYQDIAVRALQTSDAAQALQALYLSFNPQTATGSSLDLIGKLIGVARKTASYSTALATLSGTPGTTVTNGVVRDVNGRYWNLASPAVIGGGGTVTVIATAQAAGNITANPGDISSIQTPTAGWSAVTNPAAATPGQAVESDAQYRARLLLSQTKPSLTLRAGTAAAIAAVSGVTRSSVYENYFGYTASYGTVNTSGTAVTLVNGYPFDSTMVGKVININGTNYTISAVGSSTTMTIGSSAGTQSAVSFYVGDGTAFGPKNSITCIVEGGTAADIAAAIYANRGIGCLTNGTSTVTVADPLNPAITMPISYTVLGYVPVYVAVNVRALTGFTSAVKDAIAAGIVDYLNALNIGESVVFSELYGAALTARPNPEEPPFSIRAVASGAQAAQTTAATTSGSPTVTVTSATGIATGQTVVGSGIPANTTVTGVSGTTITLSANATATAASATLSFFPTGTSDLAVAYNQAAKGIAANVVVNLV